MSGPSRETVAGRAYRDLQNKAVREMRSTEELLSLYALEGFLDRLTISSRASDLVLKGGVLLAAYDSRRPTRDIDLQASAMANDTDSVLALVREIASIARVDGLHYDTAGAVARTIRDGDQYAGVRVVLTCRLATAVLPFHVDVNVGDAVWPPPTPVQIPRLLGGTITVLGYPLAMVYAEKFVTAIQRGTTSTRWRDYADIYLLSRLHEIDGAELQRSLHTVADYRDATLKPLADVLDGYAQLGQTKWAAWVRKQRLTHRLPREFHDVIAHVIDFADPPLRGAAQDQRWIPGTGCWAPAFR